jgi:MHS family proline/betaine transporter-like MFS transporter
MSSKSSRVPLWSALLGNLFEHYDTALFGLLSPFFAPLFFPKQDPVSALILTYAIIPLGMLARPLGALVFGYVGDRHGRRFTLVLTLLGMSVLSGLIALCPTYSQAGIAAPLLLCLGRVLQNFLAGGEIIGGAVFVLEQTPEKRQDLLSSIYSASTMGGILLAAAGVSALCYWDLVDSWWRALYGIGCLTALFALVLRRQLSTEPVERCSYSFSQIWKVFWECRQAVVPIVIVSGFSYATYSVSLVLMNGFVPLVSDLTKAQMMNVNTFLLIFDFAALPLFGWLAQRFSREKMMLAAAITATISALPLCMLLEGATLATVVAIRLCLVAIGVWLCAPFHAWSQKLVPAPHRYAAVSFSYAIGSQLLGGPTAAISLWLFQKTGLISSISWYWLFLAGLSTVALVKATALVKQQTIDILSAPTK